MYTSFSTALSALAAHSTAVDVVGNNLANLNTSGFKASSVSFHDMVTQSMNGGPDGLQVGTGVGRPASLREFSQGAIQTTGGALDVAIQGPGFLVMKGKAGETVYGRGGNLQVDRDGILMTPTGEKIQGWALQNGVMDVTGPVGDIAIPDGTLRPAVATTSLGFQINLDSRAVAGTPAATVTSSEKVYDSLGVPHRATLTLTKGAGPGEWSYSLTLPDADTKSPPTPVTGELRFDENGLLTSPAPTDPAPQLTVPDLQSGAAPLSIAWELFNGSKPNLTQFAETSAPALIWQNGLPPAKMVSVQVGDGGILHGHYSDGGQAVVGRLAMASIRNPGSLVAVGNNTFQVSSRSATPVVGVPGTGGRGTLVGGAVEGSTVDIAREFTNLIVLQRGYQANTRIVTTVDELSQETINLKR